MHDFGYIEGDCGTILLQIAHLSGEPGDAPVLRLEPGRAPALLRAGGAISLSDARADLIRRMAERPYVHIVEFSGDAITRCYAVRVEAPAPPFAPARPDSRGGRS